MNDALSKTMTSTESLTAPFSGSYRPDQVQFLLKPIEIESTPIAEKERLIQARKVHYSELFTREQLPEPAYLDLFWQALEQNRTRMARDVLLLAARIDARFADPADSITLVSLARAGTPVGVLLKHILEQVFSRSVAHYSVSIIRDRGIDANALNYILARHAQDSLVFVDGWTGKGVISRELARSIADFNQTYHTRLNHDLYVLSDLSGSAHAAASREDYLIPSAILNATVSGLISRSILNPAWIGPNDFHGCVYYHDWLERDLSQPLVQRVFDTALALKPDKQTLLRDSAVIASEAVRQQSLQQKRSQQVIDSMKARHKLSDINLIKPGIGEATRVLLRRVPGHVWLATRTAASVQHLLALAESKQVPVSEDPDLPYQAVAIIKEA